MRNLALLLLLTGFASCSSYECENFNPVFESSAPTDAIYKSELAKQLSADSDFIWYFESYAASADGERLYLRVVGDRLCAIAEFEVVEENPKLDGIKKAKGGGYRGAEFRDLKYTIDGDRLVFVDVGVIAD